MTRLPWRICGRASLRRLLVSCALAMVLPPAIAASRTESLQLKLEPNSLALGANLAPNPSFEAGSGGVPDGWRWHPRNTDATFRLVEPGRSGRRAAHFTNGTPLSPHVYGQLRVATDLRLEPGKTYTLSCYARSDDPGPAWIGGGDGWWMRLPLRPTGSKWRRFSKTFVARAGDVQFPLMINTDGVTAGFDVDDVKLEAGAAATPFVLEGGQPSFEWLGETPERIASRTDRVQLDYFLHAPRAAKRLRISVVVRGEGGRTLASAGIPWKAPAGIHRCRLWWDAGGLTRQRCQLTLQALEGETVLATRTDEFDLVTRSSYEQARAAAVEAGRRLEQRLASGPVAPSAIAARAVLQRFIPLAAKKLEHDRLAQAVSDLEFLADLAHRETEHPCITGAIPDPPLEKMIVREGSFWVGDQPVMILGGMGYGELQQALDTVREFGFNTVGDDYDNGYSCLRMMTGPGKHDAGAVPRLRASWDRLRQLNLAIAFNPTLHYFPEWALHRWRDITGGDEVDRLPDWSGLGRHAGKRTKSYGGFFPFAIDSPHLRQLVHDYYAALFPGVADSPAFRLVWVMNEPTYDSRDVHYLQLYREFLRRKFGDIQRANAAWRTKYKDFTEVGRPPADSPEQFDWLGFHQDQVASWFEWLAAEIRQHDRKSLLSNKPMAWTLLHPERGIDWEREAELWDVPGCDASRRPDGRDYAFRWIDAAMCFDFQKSVAPGKPLGDFEFHFCHQPDLSEDYVAAVYWHSYLHGLRWSNFWVWATGQLGAGKSGAGMKYTAWSQPRVAWGTARAALELRRLARCVAAFPGAPQVRLYFGRASLYRDRSTYPGTLSAAYQAANGLDAPVGFITDKMIRAGKLASTRLLIVPAARFVEADILARMREFARQGGSVVTVGECLTQNEYGHAYPQAARIEGAHVVVLERTTARELAMLLDPIVNQAGVERRVRCLTMDGRPAWPTECRTAVVGGKRIIYLVGLGKSPQTVQLVTPPSARPWRDLIRDRLIAPHELTLRPLEVILLQSG